MEWKKHTKKMSDLKKSNTQIDMKVRERLETMVKEMLDKDMAVSLNFLIDYLHLHRDQNDAIQELKLHIELMEGIDYGVIIDDNDQSVYVFFIKKKD
ncbi:hypothetical protein EU527_16510 [Candidatus Thorarchaeota archaeon]|nr:MAG: hypothetical protein EU527_16510 [Candidatus Thorarchaeota archaeon]